MQICQSEFLKIRYIQMGYGITDMSQGISPGVSETFSIRHGADAKRIQYDQKNSLIFSHIIHPSFDKIYSKNTVDF